jgi:pSer/pThr/pTyr-binding forkhead associated (FHA) protein
MAERRWIVGSLPDCDIRVENAAVSGRHCRLTQRGESLLLEDLESTNGTFVAGERISGPRIVRRGDSVTLGRNEPLPWPPVVRSVTIGRLAENDIVIPLDMISSQHARLEQEGDAVYLVDADSTNGTALNDPANKITRAAIQPTDQVFFGTHRVVAWELLKALPKMDAIQATALEGAALPDLERELSSPGIGSDRRFKAGHVPGNPFRFQSSWAWGIGLSVMCATLILGAARLFGPRSRDSGDTAATVESENDKTSAHAAESAPPAATIPGANSQRDGSR